VWFGKFASQTAMFLERDVANGEAAMDHDRIGAW